MARGGGERAVCAITLNAVKLLASGSTPPESMKLLETLQKRLRAWFSLHRAVSSLRGKSFHFRLPQCTPVRHLVGSPPPATARRKRLHADHVTGPAANVL